MFNEKLKAKVFISCGQARDTEEVKIAHEIKNRLIELGYDPYIAVEEQTLRGVKENIFSQLDTSEYFIFIDFKRERLVIDDNQPVVHRGSLFTHQELALASYLDIPLLAFQEAGVKQEDGIMRFLQANAIPFTDRNSLPNIVADKAQEFKWSPHWKNQLVIEIPKPPFKDMPEININKTKRYFHIQVRNLHRRKSAINCSVYLEKIFDTLKHVEIPIETTGFKWLNSTSLNSAIAPMSYRKFGAFWIYHTCSLKHLSFKGLTDTSEDIFDLSSPVGFEDLELTYLVISNNFRPIIKTFVLHIDDKIEKTKFYAIDKKEG